MDEARLQNLSVDVCTLLPTFSKDHFQYAGQVDSSVEKVKFNWKLLDSAASCNIKGNRNKNIVNLPPGKETEFVVESCSEDGSNVLQYKVKLNRLSPQNATLSSLSVKNETILPEFSSNIKDYYASVVWQCSSVEISAVPSDKSATVKINEKSSTEVVQLDVSSTFVSILVGSADGSCTETYTITFMRSPIPMPPVFKNIDQYVKFMCPICINCIHAPIKIKDTANVFCTTCIEMLTLHSKVNPLNGNVLPSNWSCNDENMNGDISKAEVTCPIKDCAFESTLANLSSHFKECVDKHKYVCDQVTCGKCNKKLSSEFEKFHQKQICSGVVTEFLPHCLPLNPKSKWESKLVDFMLDDSTAEILLKDAKSKVVEYLNEISKNANSALSILKEAIAMVATAIKTKPKLAELHFYLALLLEEQHIAKDVFSASTNETDANDAIENEAIKAGKEDEINGICALHGISSYAPLSQKLQGIEKEYQSLKNSGKSDKADYVQSLFSWKSQQATQAGKLASLMVTTETLLGRAASKFFDALALSPENAEYNLHAGRMHLERGEYEAAIARLRQSISIKPSLQISYLLLAYALSINDQSANEHKEEISAYLQESVLYKLHLGDSEKTHLYGESLWHNLNFLTLSALCKSVSFCVNLKPSAQLCCKWLVSGLKMIKKRADQYQQLMSSLLDCQYNRMLISDNNAEIATLASRLVPLTMTCGLPNSQELASLKLNSSQKFCLSFPRNSFALCLLGESQLQTYNQLGEESQLENAIASFKASLELENVISSGEPSNGLKKQKWFSDQWSNLNKSFKEESKIETKVAKPAEKCSKQPVKKPQAPAAKPIQKNTPGKSTPAKNPTIKKPTGNVKQPSKPVPPNTSQKTTVMPELQSPQPNENRNLESKKEKVLNIDVSNKPSHLTRLGLARCMAVKNDLAGAKHWYEETIKLCPEYHDAYIEAGELLEKDDPNGAIEMYTRYPFSEESTEDSGDVYLHGEIVRLMMKEKMFDDSRLCKHLISLGRGMGLPVIEKYVNILDANFKSKVLMEVYAGVNGKSVDDPDMQAFFKFKCWI